MKAHDLLDAWETSQKAPDFWSSFSRLTGLQRKEVIRLFNVWNTTPLEQVEEIAARHNLTVRQGGFQAFMYEQKYQEEGAEGCPFCPTGLKGDPESYHKMSCSWLKSQSGRTSVSIQSPTPED